MTCGGPHRALDLLSRDWLSQHRPVGACRLGAAYLLVPVGGGAGCDVAVLVHQVWDELKQPVPDLLGWPAFGGLQEDLKGICCALDGLL